MDLRLWVDELRVRLGSEQANASKTCRVINIGTRGNCLDDEKGLCKNNMSTNTESHIR
jgi:hypothetical protein